MKQTHAGMPSICPRDFDLFVGLDVDKHSLAVTLMNEESLVKSMKMPFDPQALVHYLAKHFAGQRLALAYEAGPTGYGLYDALVASKHTCLVAASANIPREPGRRVKTNRLDSVQIAQALRGGSLRGIRVPTTIYRDLRHLAHLRQAQVGQVTATKLRIKALLLSEGLAFPLAPPGSQWTHRVLESLATMRCPMTVRFTLDSLLQTLALHQAQAKKVLDQMLRFCQQDPELADSLRYLLSAPGIGPVVAVVVIAHVGDWRGLTRVREMAAFMGLVPCEDSTGEDVDKGPITHAGDAYLRSILIEAAWTAIRQDSELKAFYRRVYRRHPRDRAARVAIVAVARKLASRLFCLLKERRCYRYN
jgi:transposase